MKTIIIIFMALGSLMGLQTEQEEFVIKASYIGMEEGIYTFVDDDDMEYEFSDIDAKAASKFNLETDKFVGKKFEVTYWMDTEIDENDEEYDVYIIVNLDLVN